MMKHDSLATYPPLNTLKRVADDVWIVDGPTIAFGQPLLKMPFSTRMTIIRIGGDLLIHSPTPLTAELKTEVEGRGRPRWIVGPNRIHYWWIPDWHTAFPDTEVYLAPRIREQAAGRIDFDCQALDRDRGYSWDKDVATLPVEGSYMTEVVFFHRKSRTLVLTDLIENFEPRKLGSLLTRVLTWLGGVQHPDGSMPRDMRLSYRDKAGLRGAVETMIGWNPERIVLAHGRWYDRNGTDELRRAFRWLLG
ncbi:conserved hypothetical protein [Nitrobacter hamburgensis X14]|uniref:DUF4336 domain-containing protein n=1 Tax=Nitrobacter hamburgensis (strain DSM 10229 / NCIMB 13809 / X14) TaxID=323097 RepID=Q1QS88_NITHX|nr:DUF4336 domain-containing protein [Nitrobacter hamburgensis]ABE60909.1 conserved hypothetical protein [Nitrobacter hamburgensis X14]